jgi:hypothetical protein
MTLRTTFISRACIAICLMLIAFGVQSSAQTTPTLSLPNNATGATGSTVLIPITLSNPDAVTIDSYSIEVTFNQNVLLIPSDDDGGSVDQQGTLSPPFVNNRGCVVVTAQRAAVNNRSTLRIDASCTLSDGMGGLTGIRATSGTLINLRLKVIGTANTATGGTTLEFTVRPTGTDPVPRSEPVNGTPFLFNTINGQFFVLGATSASVTLSGRVLTANNRGLRGAIVRLTNADGSTRTAVTSAFGNYRFSDVQVGQTVTIQILSKRYAFEPQTVNLTGDVFDLNFLAQP